MRIPQTLALSVLLSATLLPAGAQVTNVIYQDNFARTGALDGSAPDTVNVPGATWLACNAPASNAQLMTDGTEIACTNSPNPTNQFYLNAYLPFTPRSGHLYVLTCQISAQSGVASGNTNGLGIGFAAKESTNEYWGVYWVGQRWMLVSGDGTQVVSRQLGTNIINNSSQSLGTTTNTFTIVMDTTTGSGTGGWQARYYLNGTQLASFSTTFANGINNYVGIAANRATGYFQQFSLVDIVPSPSPITITEQPQDRTAQVGLTTTFWVGLTNNLPQATSFQWMTNTPPSGPTNAIPGATNAVYTTPPLDSSYNGLNYSVSVSNALSGAVVSSNAALTVVSGPPAVYSAEKTDDQTHIVVAFSKAVDSTTGLNAGNYSLNNSASVISASYGNASNSIILTTSTLDTNAEYKVTVQNVQDLYGNSISGSSTMQVLPAGLALLLRADSGVILDNNGKVCQWLDQTTNGNNASQFFGLDKPYITSPSARPTMTTINGHPALSFFQGSSSLSWMEAPNSPSLSTLDGVSSGGLTMYSIFKRDAASPTADVCCKNAGNLPAAIDWLVDTAQHLYYGDGNFFGPGNGTAASLSLSTPYVLTAQLTRALNGSAANQYWLNGQANGGPGAYRAIDQGGHDCGGPLLIGIQADIGYTSRNYLNGELQTLLIFNHPLSGADRTNVDDYLGQTYFPLVITLDLPASTTSSNGFAVTYKFAANQGSAHSFNLQWQTNGMDVPGATGLTYTTPILTPGDDGQTIRVKVNLVGGGATYSTVNTLTVLNQPPYVTTAGMPIWSRTNIVVVFDEAEVDPATAANASNYALNNGATVFSAAIGDAPNKVVLTTSTLTWNANPGFYQLTVGGVKDIYGNTMVTAATPVGLYPNAALWVMANTGVSTNSGGVIGWSDLSGNGNNLINDFGVQQPQLATNAAGDPVIRFVGTNSTPTVLYANTTPTLAIVGDMSIMAAITFAAPATGNDILSKTGNGAQANIPAPYDYVLGPNASLLRGNGGNLGVGVAYGAAGATRGPSAGQPCVIAVSETGNNVSHYLNGTSAGTGSLGNGTYDESNDADAGNPLYVGFRADGKSSLTGDISELIVASQPISSGDAAELAGYMAAQHHITFVNTSPTNILFSVSGGNLTLGWPTDHVGWTLQEQTNSLLSTNWVDVIGSSVTNQVFIPVDPTNGSAFFRLIYRP